MLTKLPYQSARLTFHGDAARVTRGGQLSGTKDDGSAGKNGGETANEVQNTDAGTTTNT